MECEETGAREPIGLRGRFAREREEHRKGTQDLSRHRCGQAAPLTHPGHRQMTRLMAGLLAHGSSALFRLPVVRNKREQQWLSETKPRRLQLRGQPRHRLRIERNASPCSLLPLEDTDRASRTVKQRHYRWQARRVKSPMIIAKIAQGSALGVVRRIWPVAPATRPQIPQAGDGARKMSLKTVSDWSE